MNTTRVRWAVVVIYGIAMAWVEAAVVFYLRTMIGRIDPHQANPLPNFGNLENAELIREAATLIMVGTVGWLGGHNPRSRFAYALLVFGIWDIFYYVFLQLLTGWPHSLVDWDILFLLPLPWWGPVLSPMLIALLMILWGTIATQCETEHLHLDVSRKLWVGAMCGAVLALYVFMADAIKVAPRGPEALRTLLPTWFNWPVFLTGWILMAAPVIAAVRHVWTGPRLSAQSKEVAASL